MSILRKRIGQYWLYRWLHTRSIPATRAIARRFGHQFGFVYVGGYPKSGTKWISQLVSHYLDLPFPQDEALPLAFKCLVHHHWRHERPFDRSIYVIRDGRDVMVSEFVNMMYGMQAMRERAEGFDELSVLERALLRRFGRDARLARRMEKLFGPSCDPWDVERNLPIFIEADLKQPLSEVVRDPWPAHVEQWLAASESTVFVRYEEMLRDGQATLSRVLSELLQERVDAERVAETLGRYSFQRMTGRPPGVEDRSSPIRKGVAGDWKEYFTPEASEVFDHHAGRMLIELGYEKDRSWVHPSAET